jgi:signal transduction histidine kinase
VKVEGAAAVRADARAFDTVVRNLLQNAVLHGAATAATVHVSRPSTGTVRLVVSDNGPGMPTAALKEIGRPFARPGATSGTGVGLYVCRLLVTRMGGALNFLEAAGPAGGLSVAIDLPEAA